VRAETGRHMASDDGDGGLREQRSRRRFHGVNDSIAMALHTIGKANQNEGDE
jgi:hypothetical protein